mmetsp:Transcript_30418/g.83353  ORF Transcript_30418/g.83353 Transcript_30418/m.83353 type:complete len:211 (+) Transcript_30418:767-1399(+)
MRATTRSSATRSSLKRRRSSPTAWAAWSSASGWAGPTWRQPNGGARRRLCRRPRTCGCLRASSRPICSRGRWATRGCSRLSAVSPSSPSLCRSSCSSRRASATRGNTRCSYTTPPPSSGTTWRWTTASRATSATGTTCRGLSSPRPSSRSCTWSSLRRPSRSLPAATPTSRAAPTCVRGSPRRAATSHSSRCGATSKRARAGGGRYMASI